MNSTIIECREQDGGVNDIGNYGVWDTTLDTGITIENGDSIQMKSVFIDSVAKSSQKIVVEEEDRNIKIDLCLYNFNKDTTGKIFNDSGTVTQEQPDGKCYFVTKTNDNYADGQVRSLTSIVVEQRQSSGHESWAGFPLVLGFYDPSILAPHAISPASRTVQCPSVSGGDSEFTLNGLTHGKNADGSDKNPNYKKFPIDFRATNLAGQSIGFYKESPGNDDWDNKFYCSSWPPKQMNTQPADANGQSALDTETLEFTISLGTYSPDELARIITDNIARIQKSQLNTITGAYPLDNPFLRTQKQLRDKHGPTGTPPLLANRKVYMVSEDGADMFNYDLTLVPDYYSGASEVALLYDEGNEKFKWGALHMPYYFNEQIATNFFDSGTADKKILVNKEGGVCLLNLSPPSLWFNKMGFDASVLVVPSSITNTFGGGTKENWRVPTIARQDGITTTGAYLGTDTCVNKLNVGAGADAKAEPTVVPTLGGANPTGFTSSSSTAMYARDSLSIGHLSEAYFLVEIGINANQPFVGQGSFKNNIKGIVGKFYSTNNFTNGGMDSALEPYIHVGEPFVLSNLKCRILDPNKRVAENLGQNNTIFLQIIKAPKIPIKK